MAVLNEFTLLCLMCGHKAVFPSISSVNTTKCSVCIANGIPPITTMVPVKGDKCAN